MQHFIIKTAGLILTYTLTMVFSIKINAQWEIIQGPIPSEDRFGGMSFVNDSTGFIVEVVGSTFPIYSSRIKKTTDYGATWEIIHTIEFPSNSSNQILFNDIFFINESIGWVCGTQMNFVLKTVDGGVNWIPYPIEPSQNFNEDLIMFFDEHHGICLQRELGTSAIESYDGGLTWQSNSQLNGYDASSFSGCDYQVVSSTEIKNGEDCELEYLTFPTSAQESVPRRYGRTVHKIDENSWLFGTSSIVGFNNFASILRTDDAGQSFAILDFQSLGGSVRKFEFIDENLGFAAFIGTDGPCKILKTFDGGVHWYCQETPMFEYPTGSGFFVYGGVTDIECPSPEVCYGSSGNRIYRTFNGGGPLGQMWTSVSEIEQAVLIDFSISPNPATNHITISTNQHFSPSTQIQFFDLSGRLILTEHIQSGSNKITIDVGNLSSGIYTCVVSDKNQKYKPVKWVKE